METTMTTPVTIEALKTARGRNTGAVIRRHGDEMATTTTDGTVWASVTCETDGGPEGVEVFAPGNVADAPAMGPATFATTLRWAQLEQIVRGVVPATDTESSRYALGGVQIECREGSLLAAVATDGRRLHVAHLQPAAIAGETPQYCVVPAAAWTRVAAVARAAFRRCRGLTPRQAAEVLWRAVVTIETDGTVACLTVSHGDLSVTTAARLIEGRFPRWRDVVDPHVGVGEGLVIDVAEVAGEVADCLRAHRAAVAAGKAAWMAEPLPPRASKRRPGEYRHDRGVWLRRDGMEARGCEWRSDVAGSPVEVCLDPAFVADALAAAGVFGRTATIRAVPDSRFGGKVTDPVVVEAGGGVGERMVAVIMPLAID